MPKISAQDLNTYFVSNGSMYPLTLEANKLFESLRIHADGSVPLKLLKDRRPNEPDEIFKYRKDTYQPITKLPISKVITSFSKIRRSPDWQINFPKNSSSRIPDDESLENYCTNNLPGFTSITNWGFDILLKHNLIDANAVVAVIPLELPMDKTTFLKPIPLLFNSDQIIQYNEIDKWCILMSKRKVSYGLGNDQYASGSIFYYIDDKEILVYEEHATGYKIIYEQKNTIGQFPVFKLKAEAFKQFDNMTLNRSRIDAMVPFLDEAAVEYSDFMGSKVQHLYPLFWYFQNKECNTCNGAGTVPAPDDCHNCKPVECGKCHGSGKVVFSPFVSIAVEASAIGAQSNPVPPAGYVVRDVEILKLQAELVEKNNYLAMAAVNMQFLDQTPLNISGKAKSVDREELNNTVYNVAEDIIYTIDKVIYFINEWRNNVAVKDANKRLELLPNIPVPQNFDLLPEDYLMAELKDAITANISPYIIQTMQHQLAAKKFYNQPELAGQVNLFFELDPLPVYSVDAKMSMLSNQGITLRDYVLSNYMASFIKRAMRENKDFATMDYKAQRDILNAYADEIITENSKAQGMIDKNKQAIIKEMKKQNTPAAAGSGA